MRWLQFDGFFQDLSITNLGLPGHDIHQSQSNFASAGKKVIFSPFDEGPFSMPRIWLHYVMLSFA
jgi:hypothetical protein